MFSLSQLLYPFSHLIRTLREVSKPTAPRMRRKARRLDASAAEDMAAYWRTKYRERGQKLLDRSRRKAEEAIRLRRDADLLDAQESVGRGDN